MKPKPERIYPRLDQDRRIAHIADTPIAMGDEDADRRWQGTYHAALDILGEPMSTLTSPNVRSASQKPSAARCARFAAPSVHSLRSDALVELQTEQINLFGDAAPYAVTSSSVGGYGDLALLVHQALEHLIGHPGPVGVAAAPRVEDRHRPSSSAVVAEHVVHVVDRPGPAEALDALVGVGV